MVAKPSPSAISVASVAKATELKASRPSVTSKFVSNPRLKLCCSRNSTGTKNPSNTGSRQAANAHQPLMPRSCVRAVSRGLSAENSVATLRRP